VLPVKVGVVSEVRLSLSERPVSLVGARSGVEGAAGGPKVALTERAWSIVTWQLSMRVYEQSPDQPVKVEEASGVAVRVTSVPASKTARQVSPQSIPAGLELTSPEPAPCFDTVRE